MDGEADIIDFGLAVSDPLASRAKAAAPGADWSAYRAVTELHARHYDKLVRVALLVTGDLPTAKDVTQDAFASVYLRWKKLRNADDALAYLRRAVVSNALSVLRHRAVAARNAELDERHEPSAGHEALIQLESSALAAALRKLSARQRAAVVLRYYGDLSEAEIATAMGISEGTAKSHTSRGMAALRAELARRQDHHCHPRAGGRVRTADSIGE
jgi:RNA polymerase sigma-70 factor (sigma-E family)